MATPAGLRFAFPTPAAGDEAQAPALGIAATLYVGTVMAVGAIGLVALAPRAYPHPWLTLGLLAATVPLSLLKLRLPLARGASTMTLTTTLDFVALLLVGVDLAMIVGAVGALLQCTVHVRRPQPWYRTAFSVASVVIAVQAAGWTWRLLGGGIEPMGLMPTLLPLATAATVYFAVNTGLVAGAISISGAGSVTRIWRREFLWSANAYLLSALVAAAIAFTMQSHAHLLVPLALAPLFVSYRAFRASVRRLEDNRRHAAELKRTIAASQEALARALASEAALAAETEALALTQARLNVTLQTIRSGVLTVDASGTVVLMNASAQRIASIADDTSTPHMRGVFQALGIPAADGGAALRRVLADGRPVVLRNDAPGCEPTARVVELRGTPTKDGIDRVSGAVWVLTDVTDAARLDEERSRAAKLESIGALAGGLAHDFNNILIGIVGNLSLAKELAGPADESLKTRLQFAEAACARAKGVTTQLLTFAKGGAPVKSTASIADLAMECTRFALTGSSVASRFEIDPDLWLADIDSGQVGQVVHNLVLNAKQATTYGGTVTVRVQNVEVQDDSTAPPALVPGRYVRLVVQDQGVGIAPEHMGRIFEPYFTTKEKGSGLGLAVSYSIVRAHGGAITVTSEPGRGARFEVYLPASTNLVPAVAPRPSVPPQASRGRLLLMDDDASVAEVASDMLAVLGYEVEVAPSGQAAVDRFRQAETDGEPFDLVILDLTVPGGMGGREAVQFIRKIRPSVRAVVTSGYADDFVLARFGEFGFDGVLPKPFSIPDLRRSLEVVHATAEPVATVAGLMPFEEALGVDRSLTA